MQPTFGKLLLTCLLLHTDITAALFFAPAGSGTDLAIDCMGGGPYGLLVSNADMGYGSRPWGAQALTTDVSSFLTAWNIKSQVKVRTPPVCSA